ncbi:MAG: universal stress protein [Nitrosomonas sp.]|nr:universal stress protein [Nitrosomonas sp.]
MSQYNHILLTIDFSEDDELVATKAKDLANKLNAELSIIHILDDIPMPDTPYGTVIPLDKDSSYPMLEAEKTQLKQMADHLSITPTNRWLVWGEPKQEIALFAEREKIDLIIVGSHGRHGIALLLGSTANGVLHHAKCDVLAVRLPD